MYVALNVCKRCGEPYNAKFKGKEEGLCPSCEMKAVDIMSDEKKNYYALNGGKDVLDIIPDDEFIPFARWSVITYMVRAGKKTEDMESDLLKSKDYIERILERVKK